jgi:hypothetical protein
VLVLNTYSDAHYEAQDKLQAFMQGDGAFSSQELASVTNESKFTVSKAEEALKALKIPDKVLQSLHTKQAIRVVLHAQEELIEDLEANGILKDKDVHGFYKIVRTNFRKINETTRIVDDQFDLDRDTSTHGSYMEYDFVRMARTSSLANVFVDPAHAAMHSDLNEGEASDV